MTKPQTRNDVASKPLLVLISKLQFALARACGDSCLCDLRHAQGIMGKCYKCDGRSVLAEVEKVLRKTNPSFQGIPNGETRKD